jgi:hypothetical protein
MPTLDRVKDRMSHTVIEPSKDRTVPAEGWAKRIKAFIIAAIGFEHMRCN